MSTNDLAPLPNDVLTSDASTKLTADSSEQPQLQQTEETSELVYDKPDVQTDNKNLYTKENNDRPLRRSSRICKPPERYGGVVTL